MSAPDRLAAIRERVADWLTSPDCPCGLCQFARDTAVLLVEVDRLRAEADRAHELAGRVMALEGELSGLIQMIEDCGAKGPTLTWWYEIEMAKTRARAALARRAVAAPTEGGTNREA